MERKNKLCPFCGGYSYYNLSDQWHNNNYRFVWVECSKCRAKGPKIEFSCYPNNHTMSLAQAQNKASMLWNQRTNN